MPVTPTKFDTQDEVVLQWVGETGTGVAVRCNQWPDKSIQATGTGTVTLFGSPDGTNFVALKNTLGTPVAISLDATTNAIDVIRENPIFIRPVVTTGTATVTITGNKA